MVVVPVAIPTWAGKVRARVLFIGMGSSGSTLNVYLSGWSLALRLLGVVRVAVKLTDVWRQT